MVSLAQKLGTGGLALSKCSKIHLLAPLNMLHLYLIHTKTTIMCLAISWLVAVARVPAETLGSYLWTEQC